jgi:hypothetical protein
MKKLKILFPLLVFTLMLGQASYGQNAKMQERAKEQLENLNSRIVEGDPGAALTPEQREKIMALYLDKQVKMKEIRESDLSEDEKAEKRKALNKETARVINQEILTKAQRQAKRKANEDE